MEANLRINMKITGKLLGVAVFALMLMPVGAAQAATYYTNYNGQQYSQQELINYLYELIAQLQAQLGSGGGYGGGYSNYNVEVETVGANYVTDDSASLYGEVDLGRASTARVWFDYGLSTSFGEKTLTGTARSGRQYTFRADLDGLLDDRQYYYRAVAEDPAGRAVYGSTKNFTTDDDGRGGSRYDEEPDVTTDDADDVTEDSAELNGEVDMNDFDDGIVFFVYGQDEDQVEDVEYDYDSYDDIDEDGDDLQKVEVEDNFDGSDDFREDVDNLERDEEYFFQMCVEYDDEDGDETIICGGVEEFETDDDGGSSNDDEPDVRTESAENVEEDEAELHGEVDMNDFDNGIVFFVYGEDEDQIEDVEDDYDTYSDVDEDGDDLQKVRMDSDLDGSANYELRVRNLDDDTEYFFQICVEYEDEDDDEVLMCGGVEDFETDD